MHLPQPSRHPSILYQPEQTMPSTFLTTIFAATILAMCQSVAVEFSSSGDAGYLGYLHGLRDLVSEHGCDIDICFALDGGSKVTPEDFKCQKDFVDIIMQIIQVDKRINYCAVQYGDSMEPITTLHKSRRFLKSMAKAEQVGGNDISTTTMALQASQRFLQAGGKSRMKILALGAGWNHITSRTKKVASRLLADGIDISTIAIGDSDRMALNVVSGYPRRALTLERFTELPLLVSSVIIDVCGYH